MPVCVCNVVNMNDANIVNDAVIQLNHRPYPLREGATVASVMKENNFDFPAIIVKVNGVLVDETQWVTKEIANGDDVEIIHVFGGG